MPNKIFIVAGELSGDLHGGKLVRALKNLRPDLQIAAIGGDQMAQAGAELLFHIRQTAFMGFVEVVRHFRIIRHIWYTTMDFLDKFRPDVVVTIDYPGFNLRLARAASQRGIPVVYYISPQIWAWHQSRLKKIKKYTREVLCILPFEADWYLKHHVKAQFVGHPLLDQESPASSADLFANCPRPLIGLFPGSRVQEVRQILPIMVKAVARLRQFFPTMEAVVAMAPNLEQAYYSALSGTPPIRLITGHNWSLMRNADALLIASGTATLEATIQHTPYVVIYKINPLSYLLARFLVQVNSITIANLVSGRRGVVELVQSKATPEHIAFEIHRILTNKEYNAELRGFLAAAHARLGAPGAAQRAAQAIMRYLPDGN